MADTESAVPTGFNERHRLLEAFEQDGAEAMDVLVEALDDERPLVRRTAAHLLVRLGESAREAFDAALENPDFQVRRIVIDALAEMGLIEEYWPTILLDDHPSIRRDVQLVLLEEHPLPEGEAMDRLMDRFVDIYADAPSQRREHVVELFTSFDSLSPQARRVLIAATEDVEERIRETAYAGILEHIDRDWDEAGALLAAARDDDAEAIQDIALELRWKLLEVEQVRMPVDGWRFKKDPDDVGRDGQWYAPDFDDSDWRSDIPIEDSWQNHLDNAYNGVAWYRRSFEVPELPDWDRAYLHFEGVDEQAWVWLNGEFVGEHTLGAVGWDIPFVLDVADVVQPGETNQITVRAENTRGGAGIWQPVRLRVLDSNQVD